MAPTAPANGALKQAVAVAVSSSGGGGGGTVSAGQAVRHGSIYPRPTRETGRASLSPSRSVKAPHTGWDGGPATTGHLANSGSSVGRGCAAGRVGGAADGHRHVNRDLEHERQRIRDLEARVQDLVSCVEREMQRASLAQQRADAAEQAVEEQQTRFTGEVEKERQRAQRLEERFGGLVSFVEELTRQAKETACMRGDLPSGFPDLAARAVPQFDGNVAEHCGQDVVPTCGSLLGPLDHGHLAEERDLASHVRALKRQLEDANGRADVATLNFEAKEAECAKMRLELRAVCAERAELDVLQAEHNGKVGEYLERMIKENDRRAEVIADRDGRLREIDEEKAELLATRRRLEHQVHDLREENRQLRSQVAAAEAHNSSLRHDTDRLASESVKGRASCADQKREMGDRLSNARFPPNPLASQHLEAPPAALTAVLDEVEAPPIIVETGSSLRVVSPSALSPAGNDETQHHGSCNLAQWMHRSDADAILDRESTAANRKSGVFVACRPLQAHARNS